MSRATTTGLHRVTRRTAPPDTPTSRQPRRNTTSARHLYSPHVSRAGPVLSCRGALAPKASYSHMSDYVARGGKHSSSATRRKRRYRQGVSNQTRPTQPKGPQRSVALGHRPGTPPHQSAPTRHHWQRTPPAATIAAAPILSAGVNAAESVSGKSGRRRAAGCNIHRQARPSHISDK